MVTASAAISLHAILTHTTPTELVMTLCLDVDRKFGVVCHMRSGIRSQWLTDGMEGMKFYPSKEERLLMVFNAAALDKIIAALADDMHASWEGGDK